MWIPAPIYERLPQSWLILGLVFMNVGRFIGFDHKLSFVLFGAGMVCCLWSMWVFTMRLRNREVPKESQQQAELAEQQSNADSQQGTETIA